ncbi:MAG TPA: hypothetical protein VGM81_17885 [Burkholderiaceae bacterium]|jgi:hypothetical protein
MSEKNLSESEWKKFAKSRDLKDTLFIKALIALEKARSPDDALAALDDIGKQAEALRKSAKADKELTAYLDGVDKSLDKERKLNRAALKEAEASEDEEEESPALLTTKMLPLVRQVKKGDEMQVLLASTGKEVAVLLSRRSISPSRRKLMTEYLNSGAPKFIAGTCIFEENAYTFVVKTQAAGLAKRVKAALLKQVELRLKVRVRGEDPNDVDDDGEEDTQEESVATTSGKPANARAPAVASERPAAAQGNAENLEALYAKRMAALQPRLLAAIRANGATASKLRAVAEFAQEKATAGGFKAALQALESAEALLKQESAASPSASAGSDEFKARLLMLMPELKNAVAAGGLLASRVKQLTDEASALARDGDFKAALARLEELPKVQAYVRKEEVDRRLQAELKQVHQARRAELLGQWKKAGAESGALLSRLVAAIKESEHEEADEAAKEVDLILARLSETPDSLARVHALVDFLLTDEILADAEEDNIYDIKIDIRRPLLEILFELEEVER